MKIMLSNNCPENCIDNSAFSYNDTLNKCHVQVNGLPTSIQVNPTIITDAVNQYEAIPLLKSYNHRKCSVVKHHRHRRNVTDIVFPKQKRNFTNSITLDPARLNFG